MVFCLSAEPMPVMRLVHNYAADYENCAVLSNRESEAASFAPSGHIDLAGSEALADVV
jgi:hypothetical protein